MQRIAVIAGVLHSGGKRNLIMEYYRHIDRTKVQFDFICDSDSNGIPEEEIRSLGGRVYKVAPYKDIIPHLKETYKILKKNQYEVMHAFDNTLNLFPMFLGCVAGVKVRIFPIGLQIVIWLTQLIVEFGSLARKLMIEER